MSIQVKSLAGEWAVFADEQLAELRMLFRGTLLTPQDNGYEEARVVQNRMIDRHPGLIVRCSGPGAVVSTTGVAGLTLGGGIGWLHRKWGLA